MIYVDKEITQMIEHNEVDKSNLSEDQELFEEPLRFTYLLIILYFNLIFNIYIY